MICFYYVCLFSVIMNNMVVFIFSEFSYLVIRERFRQFVVSHRIGPLRDIYTRREC